MTLKNSIMTLGDIAAASLYVSCLMNGEKVSRRRFAIESGISDVTIRNRSSLIKKKCSNSRNDTQLTFFTNKENICRTFLAKKMFHVGTIFYT